MTAKSLLARLSKRSSTVQYRLLARSLCNDQRRWIRDPSRGVIQLPLTMPEEMWEGVAAAVRRLISRAGGSPDDLLLLINGVDGWRAAPALVVPLRILEAIRIQGERSRSVTDHSATLPYS